jgi:D-alanyl-D-alanine carboxypeptidase/D-alanyl-D-alanine-endopeptidase (penicillin-binding protein 4)
MLVKVVTISLLLLFTNVSKVDRDQVQNLVILAQSVPKKEQLRHGYWSIYVSDVRTGNVILDINAAKSLAPASNLKLLTSAVALEVLGEDKKFDTYLEYSGTINKDGHLDGNLYIRGEGDPTLGSSEMDDVILLDSLIEQWLGAINKAGITQVKGNIIGDDSYLDYMPLPGDWFWTDMGNYYAANTSGLCIHENLYRLYFKPGKRVGDPANVLRTEPEIPGLAFFNHMKTGAVGSGDNGYIYAAPWQYVHQLEGTIPAGVSEFSIKGALPDPAKFAAQLLYDKMRISKIKIRGEVYTQREYNDNETIRTKIHATTSPKLKDIIYRLNKRSVNLYAEQLLKILGKEIEGQGTFEAGIKVIEEWLEEKDIYKEGMFLHDGSGLSRSNATPTRLLVELLNTVYREPYFQSFYNSLGIAGDPTDIGYMKNMCKGTRAANNLRAKTGSINRVRAHTGYVYTRNKKLLSFSMIANEYRGSMRAIDKLHEKLMIQLAELP